MTSISFQGTTHKLEVDFCYSVASWELQNNDVVWTKFNLSTIHLLFVPPNLANILSLEAIYLSNIMVMKPMHEESLGVVEPNSLSPRQQHNTCYAADTAEVFEREFGEGGVELIKLWVTQVVGMKSIQVNALLDP